MIIKLRKNRKQNCFNKLAEYFPRILTTPSPSSHLQKLTYTSFYKINVQFF